MPVLAPSPRAWKAKKSRSPHWHWACNPEQSPDTRYWSPRQKHTKLASPPASNPQDLQSRTVAVAVAEAVAEAVARRPLSATTSPLAPCRGPLPFLRSSGPRPPLPASHRSATTPPNPIELHKRVFVPLPSVYPISRRLTLSSFLFLLFRSCSPSFDFYLHHLDPRFRPRSPPFVEAFPQL